MKYLILHSKAYIRLCLFITLVYSFCQRTYINTKSPYSFTSHSASYLPLPLDNSTANHTHTFTCPGPHYLQSKINDFTNQHESWWSCHLRSRDHSKSNINQYAGILYLKQQAQNRTLLFYPFSQQNELETWDTQGFANHPQGDWVIAHRLAQKDYMSLLIPSNNSHTHSNSSILTAPLQEVTHLPSTHQLLAMRTFTNSKQQKMWQVWSQDAQQHLWITQGSFSTHHMQIQHTKAQIHIHPPFKKDLQALAVRCPNDADDCIVLWKDQTQLYLGNSTQLIHQIQHKSPWNESHKILANPSGVRTLLNHQHQAWLWQYFPSTHPLPHVPQTTREHMMKTQIHHHISQVKPEGQWAIVPYPHPNYPLTDAQVKYTTEHSLWDISMTQHNLQWIRMSDGEHYNHWYFIPTVEIPMPTRKAMMYTWDMIGRRWWKRSQFAQQISWSDEQSHLRFTMGALKHLDHFRWIQSSQHHSFFINEGYWPSLQKHSKNMSLSTYISSIYRTIRQQEYIQIYAIALFIIALGVLNIISVFFDLMAYFFIFKIILYL